MALVVLIFFLLLLATFGLVMVITRESPQEKTVEQRMALIHIPKAKAGGTAERDQLLKATNAGGLGGWMKFSNLTHSRRWCESRFYRRAARQRLRL
jgi:Na+-transporting methylmalonyl-CoA/oxaloacetate decarboxylase gamma subunit